MSPDHTQRDRHISAVDYVAGQLPAAERQIAEEHLVDCTHCQAAVEAVRQVSSDQPGQNTKAMVGYLADLLVSTVVLVAPVANQLSQPTPPPEPGEEATEQLIFEPLRVLQPRVDPPGNRRGHEGSRPLPPPNHAVAPDPIHH